MDLRVGNAVVARDAERAGVVVVATLATTRKEIE